MTPHSVLARWAALAVLALAAGAASTAHAVDTVLSLSPCRLDGVEHAARCGVLRRPLDPSRPQGPQIDVHVAVLPALARNKKPDAVLFFAGGPGQSAIDLAGPVLQFAARLSNRRDVILIDQRGTGRSAPLQCEAEAPTRALQDSIDTAGQRARLDACRVALQKLPHGDLRQYTTSIAMTDADAVRRALGIARVDLVGASYGTRAALEYLRQFPQSVRRVVIDGIAPPDMALPAAFSPDTQAAFDALLTACEADASCASRHPQLRTHWRRVLAGLPRDVSLSHPVTGREERLVLTRDMLLGLVRAPLYVPALAAALPHAIDEAAAGRYGAVVGLAAALGGSRRSTPALAMGMHLSVVCAEDMPRLAASTDRPGADFGNAAATMYRDVCGSWPRGDVPAAFYTVPPAPVATLLLSGSADPATPPRHGERVAKALGAKARHVVVANAGHGTMAIGCLRDVVYRFIDTDDEAVALAAVEREAACAANLPRPPAFAMPQAAPAVPLMPNPQPPSNGASR